MELFYAAKKRAEDAGDAKASEWFGADGKKEDDSTPLHLAAWGNALEAARRLLEVNVDVDALAGEKRGTPLRLAAFQGHAELIQVLLEAKADPFARNIDGETPMDLAIQQHGGRGLAPFARGAPSLAVLTALVALEGPETVEALEGWKKEAKKRYGDPLECAHLRQRLRVILAKGRKKKGNWCLDASEDYANLKDQNIIAKPEVQASLWYLPGLSAADACDADLLEALAKTANEEVFQTDTVQAVVQAAWAQMRFSTAWEVVSCLLMVVLLCVASYTFRHELPQATDSWREMST